MKMVKAKKQYKCDLTGKIIGAGELYKRVNIRDVGIFHFKKECSDEQIKNYITEQIDGPEDYPFCCGENGFWY